MDRPAGQNNDATLGPGKTERLERAVHVVYEELRRLAQRQLAGERRGHTLQPTALVHEAYARLANNAELKWQNQAHFMGLAAGIMRQVLVDHARKRNASKRDGKLQRVTLYEETALADETSLDVLDLHEAIEKLGKLDTATAQLVELRYFGGLTLEDSMEVLGQTRRTVEKNWAFARVWLSRELGDS